MAKRETRKERDVRVRDEIKTRLLSTYKEGQSNIDWDNIPKSEQLELIWAFTDETESRNVPLIPKAEWLERSITKELSEITNIPNHRLQDPEAKVVKYRQRFLESCRNVLPDIFEELRPLVPRFQALFSNKTEKDFIAIINDLQLELIRHRGTFSQSWSDERWHHDFIWGDLIETLYYSKFAQHVDDPDFAGVLSEGAMKIIEYEKYTLLGFSAAIKRNLKLSAANPEDILDYFFTLHVAIYNWAQKHNLCKDWLIDYAYYFVSQFSENPEIEVRDIFIPPRNYHSRTKYFDFEFKSAGWLSSEDGETVKQYTDRVTKEFNEALGRYTREATAGLGLDKLKKFTRPPTFENVVWLAYRVLKGWDSEQIVEKFFHRVATDRTRSALGAKAFESKKKHVESEMRKLKEYGLPFPK